MALTNFHRVGVFILLLGCLLVLSACNLPVSSMTQDIGSNQTSQNPSGVGESRQNPIPFGETLSVPGWNIQVLEFLRGSAAADLINSGSRTFDPPPDGYEYALVKFFLRCTSLDDSPHSLSLSELFITGSSSTSFTDRLDGWPQPEFLFEDMYTAEAVEGWIDALVPTDETHLMAVLDVDAEEQHYTHFFALTEDETGFQPDDPIKSQPNDLGAELLDQALVGQRIVMPEWALTIKSALKGDQALARLRQNDSGYGGPEEGSDYVLLEVEIDYFSTDKRPQMISNYNFYAVDEDGNTIDRGRIRFPNDLTFTWINGKIFSGAKVTGWVIINVPASAENPIIAFDPGDFTSHWDATADEVRYIRVE